MTFTRSTARDLAVAASLAACAGALASRQPSLEVGLLVAAAAVPFVLTMTTSLPLVALTTVLVVCTQLTRGRFYFAGFHFLPEHAAIVALAVAMLLRWPSTLLRRAAAYEVFLLGWIAWNLVVSLLYSPDLRNSLAIVAWMTLAWVILWCVRSVFLAEPASRDRVLDVGARLGAALGAASFALWVVALLGGTTIAVQPEFVTGTHAAKGLALEANFLGAHSLCWLFVVVHRRMADGVRPSTLTVAGLLLGVVASMTRAVWIALIGGALVLAMLSFLRTSLRRDPVGGGARGMVVVAVGFGAVLLLFGGPVVEKLGASFDFTSNTGGVRAAEWERAWRDVTASGAYLTGLGTNSYGQRHLSRTDPGEAAYLGNLPLTLLYDSGVVGALLFTGAMGTFVVRDRSPRGRQLKVLFVLALLVIGAATSPVWFGFVWITIAALDAAPRRTPTVPPGTAMAVHAY